jgi:phage shock protein A
MTETIFARVRRIISGSVEDAVDAMERAGGTSVMREAIREVDRALDDVRAEYEAATARRLQAGRQQRLLREKLGGLEAKARFALGEGREDLAEAAIARQLDLEGQAERLGTAEADAGREAARLEESLTVLSGRKAQMEEALATFEAAQREASPDGGSRSASPDRRPEHRVKRAEAAFDRAMAGAGGVAGVGREDAQAAAKVAEIDVLQRSAVIAERLAALRSSQTAA